MTVALVDYGAGNLPSVERAFRRLGAETTRARDAYGLRCARAIVLPGVGHFAALARALDAQGLRARLREAIVGGTPFLGICLGMQALWERSEEAPDAAGLGVVPGSVLAMRGAVKLPHMGWNRVAWRHGAESHLLTGMPEGAWFYFAHSYAAPDVGSAAVGVSTHGVSFTAAFEAGTIFGVQFHPEKSGATGARVLANFLRAVR